MEALKGGMPKLEWDELFATGIDRYDNQHKVLFDYINDLRQNAFGKAGPEAKAVIEKVLNSMLNYSLTHFLDEEVELYRHRFPGFDDHKAEHDQFLIAVRDLFIRFKAGKSDMRIICAEILAVSSEWLQGHILVKDKAYGEFLKSKGFN